jgi:hypothetical protein
MSDNEYAGNDAGRLAIAQRIYTSMETFKAGEMRPRTVSLIQIALQDAFEQGQRHHRKLYEQQWPDGKPIETKAGGEGTRAGIGPAALHTVTPDTPLPRSLRSMLERAALEPHEKFPVQEAVEIECACGNYNAVGAMPVPVACPICGAACMPKPKEPT